MRRLDRIRAATKSLAFDVMSKSSGVEQMSRADRDRWAQARTPTDVGELVAQWLEGRIASQPGYCGPVDVDEDDAPGLTAALAAANRAGLVTNGSQAGCDDYDEHGNHWQQYAAVVGFATGETLDWLRDMVVAPPGPDGSVVDTGLCLTHCASTGLFGFRPVDPVTFCNGRVATDFGNQMPARDLRDDWTGYGVCHPDAVQALAAAEQIVIRDSEFGRNDRLWPALRAAADQCIAASGADLARANTATPTGQQPLAMDGQAPAMDDGHDDADGM